MEKKLLIYLLFIFSFYYSLAFEFESIEENIPKTSILHLNNSYSFKIFEYIPNCYEDQKETKNIFIQIYTSFRVVLYIYDDNTKIEQNTTGQFINFNYRNIFSNGVKKYKDFICKQKYYFVVANDNINSFIPILFQLSVLDENNNANLISTSQDYTFFQRTNTTENLFYTHTEDKIALINFKGDAQLKIFENEEKIYDKNSENLLKFEFKKNKRYNISFSDNSVIQKSLVFLQFLDDSKYLNHNFDKSPLILLDKYKYYLEIDISNYSVGEYILFLFYSDFGKVYAKYQYKKQLNGNNFINLGKYSINDFNFISIKKNEEDDKLILYIQAYNDESFTVVDLLKYKVQGINSENPILSKGPNLLYIDYFSFNKLNSFGFYSNQPYFYIQQQINDESTTSDIKHKNLSIITKRKSDILSNKKALIYFNMNDDFKLEIKKYNYPILNLEFDDEEFHNFKDIKMNEYLQLCQGDESKDELYYYINNNNIYDGIEVFEPIFGNIQSYFIEENDIKTLSDFDFDKIKETNFYKTNNKTGFLKIKCNKEPSMIKHINLNFAYDKKEEELKILSTGKRYNFFINKLNNFIIDSKYINENLQLKFTVYGLNPNESIELLLGENTYNLTDIPFKLNFPYKNNSDTIYFKADENIKDRINIEIIVGFLPQDLNSFQTIEFTNALGSLIIEPHKGNIIKVPKDFKEDYYEFSINIPEQKSLLDIQITYDKKEFAVPRGYIRYDEIYPIIPLFNVNPYTKIPSNLNSSDDKFFYITIYNGGESNHKLFIKKPKNVYELKLNQINVIPKLEEENKNYYHRIVIPKGDYQFLTIQPLKNGTDPNEVSISKDNIFYGNAFHNYYLTLPMDETQSSYINFFCTDDISFINLIPRKEYFYKYNSPYDIINEIKQIEGTKKYKINITSLSYQLYPNIFKYHLLINIDSIFDAYQIITEQKNFDLKKQKMIVVNDDGLKETFEYEIELDIELNKDNKLIIIPIEKDNNLIEAKYKYYNFSYLAKLESSYWIYYIIGGAILFLIIAIIIIFLFCRHLKNKKAEADNPSKEKIINEELSSLSEN